MQGTHNFPRVLQNFIQVRSALKRAVNKDLCETVHLELIDVERPMTKVALSAHKLMRDDSAFRERSSDLNG